MSPPFLHSLAQKKNYYNKLHAVLTRCDSGTSSEWISLVAGQTAAHGIVLDHITLRVRAARSRTRIAAFLVQTRQIARALTVDNTFGPAVGWGADVAGQTAASGHASLFTALGVAAARVGLTGVDWRRLGYSFCCN